MTEVAVKTLSVDASIEKRIMFLQEAHVMSQFCHPNIVQLFGVIAEGNPVSSMACIQTCTHCNGCKSTVSFVSLIPIPAVELMHNYKSLFEYLQKGCPSCIYFSLWL